MAAQGIWGYTIGSTISLVDAAQKIFESNQLVDTTPAIDDATPAIDDATPAIDDTTPAIDDTTPAIDDNSSIIVEISEKDQAQEVFRKGMEEYEISSNESSIFETAKEKRSCQIWLIVKEAMALLFGGVCVIGIAFIPVVGTVCAALCGLLVLSSLARVLGDLARLRGYTRALDTAAKNFVEGFIEEEQLNRRGVPLEIVGSRVRILDPSAQTEKLASRNLYPFNSMA